MIPVKVPHDAHVHTVGGVRRLAPDDPLYNHPCVVCGHDLLDEPVTLVYVGVEPDNRRGIGEMEGVAVPVHVLCTDNPR